MKYGLIGASGKLGKEVINVFADNNHELVFTFDLTGEWFQSEPEVLIDCSLPEAFDEVLSLATKFSSPLVVATTGLKENNFNKLKELSNKICVVQSYNFSLGIQILLQLTKKANELLTDWDVEISETHHRFKKDKPSGTAKMLQEIFKDRNINTSSFRLGNVPGDHSISFAGMGEVIKLEHRALSRRTFAEGILLSAEFALKQEDGFYTFTDVVFNKKTL
ncbi:MAG: 4-hydroxy-tetrahydrodipicolinate reductase [Ignavibacteriaceae bacterium]|nr:4-hydroxy-tetrahydrodipicolinate reductase [Ignavibacteria bacterium]NNJ52986.1 4-hydroxy-tetrahydrodipicolinate reductase [Ignavibacteriaceae bacterium]